jgi:large subunit ribosomal protein L16
MLIPKKVKHRKWQTGRIHPTKMTKAKQKGSTVSFGEFGLKATSYNRIASNQIEAARRAMSRHLGKTGRAWIRIFPDRPVTKKPAEMKMGKGKGDPQYFVCEVFPGRIIFEVDGAPADVAKEALRKAGTKLPVKTKIVARD